MIFYAGESIRVCVSGLFDRNRADRWNVFWALAKKGRLCIYTSASESPELMLTHKAYRLLHKYNALVECLVMDLENKSEKGYAYSKAAS